MPITLTDDFSTDSRATKWPSSYGTTGVSGGVGTVTSSSSSQYSGLRTSTTTRYSAVDSYLKVKMTLPTSPPTDAFPGVQLQSTTDGTDLAVSWNQDTLRLGPRVGWSFSSQGTVAVAAGSTIWVGIAEGSGASHFGGTGTAGNVYWYTSTNGTTWTQRHTVASPSYVNSVHVTLEMAASSLPASPVTVTFDDVNVDVAAPITATPSGIGSGEAHGTPVHSGALTASPGGIASGHMFGAVVAALVLTVSPSGIASSEAIGTPTYSGTWTATPAGISTGEAFGTPAAGGVLIAGPSGIAGAEAFGTPLVSGQLTAAPSGIAGAEVFGTPSVSGLLTAAPSGVASGEAFGTPSVGAGLSASPAGIVSGEVFGSPAASGSLTASPGGVGSAEAFGSPSALSGLTGMPAGIPSGEAFGSPAAIIPWTAAPVGIASSAGLGTPVVSGALIAGPVGVGSGEAFGSPVAFGAVVASPAGIPSKEAFGSPSNIQALTASPAGIGTGELFGTAAASGGMFRDLVLTAGPLGDRFRSAPLLPRFAPDVLEDRFMPVSLAGRWSVARLEGEPVRKEILVSAGAVEYVGGTVTEVTGKDISAAVFMMSLGGPVNPGAWVAPSVSTAGSTSASRVLKLLVNSTTARGSYYCWARVSDSPEVAPVRFPQEIIVR